MFFNFNKKNILNKQDIKLNKNINIIQHNIKHILEVTLNLLLIFISIYKMLCFYRLILLCYPTVILSEESNFVMLLTRPYFRLWQKVLPRLRYKIFKTDLSLMWGLFFIKNLPAAIIYFRDYLIDYY